MSFLSKHNKIGESSKGIPISNYQYNKNSSDDDLPAADNLGGGSVLVTPSGYYLRPASSNSNHSDQYLDPILYQQDSVRSGHSAISSTPGSRRSSFGSSTLPPLKTSRAPSNSHNSRADAGFSNAILDTQYTQYTQAQLDQLERLLSDDPISRKSSTRRPKTPNPPYPTETMLSPRSISPLSSPKLSSISRRSSIEQLRLAASTGRQQPITLTPARTQQADSLARVIRESTYRTPPRDFERGTARRRRSGGGHGEDFRIPVISNVFDIIDGADSIPDQYKLPLKVIVIFYALYEVNSFLSWFSK